MTHRHHNGVFYRVSLTILGSLLVSTGFASPTGLNNIPYEPGWNFILETWGSFPTQNDVEKTLTLKLNHV